jgi:indole-3-glycerol phosphate synthase
MPVAWLDELVASATERVKLLRAEARELESEAARSPVPPSFQLQQPDAAVGIIAEIKRRSPSAGSIQERLDPVEHARAYAGGGAVAISVLTEETGFGGSLDDLRSVCSAVTVPVLRKDFILDELQLFQTRVAGAAGVLLIARILSPERLRDLLRAATGLGLAALVEAHTAQELEVALAAGAAIIGINSRDLDDFTIDHNLVERLLPRVPPSVTAVAESGIESRRDVERLARAGADAVLVGSAVARSADPRTAVRGLVGVPRHTRTAP